MGVLSRQDPEVFGAPAICQASPALEAFQQPQSTSFSTVNGSPSILSSASTWPEAHKSQKHQDDPLTQFYFSLQFTGVQLPSGGREHRDIRGRGAPLRVDLRRQNHPCVGVRHPGADQVYCRPGAALNSGRRGAPQQAVVDWHLA